MGLRARREWEAFALPGAMVDGPQRLFAAEHAIGNRLLFMSNVPASPDAYRSLLDAVMAAVAARRPRLASAAKRRPSKRNLRPARGGK